MMIPAQRLHLFCGFHFFAVIVLSGFNAGRRSGELYAVSSGENCMSVLKLSLSNVASLDTR